MRCLLLISLMLLMSAVTARKYSSKHDRLDIEKLVSSPGYMKASVNCYLERGNCDKTSATLKRAIAEIVRLACENCTLAQKHILKRYLEELKKTLPEDYAAFKEKYDPDRRYFDLLEAAILKY